MKKKLFIFLAVAIMLVCVFAVSASAVTPNNDGEVFIATDGTTLALYDTDGKALAWFYDSTTSQYVPYRVGIDFTMSLNSGRELLPSTVISDTDGDDNTAFPYTVSNMILMNGRDYSAFTYISGTWKDLPIQAIYVNNAFRWINKTSFNSNSTLRVFDIPKEHSGSLHIGAAFVRANALESFYIPKEAYFEGTSTFEYSTGIKSVEFHDEWEGTLKGYEFNGCTALETLVLPSTITSIPIKLCYGCSSLTTVNIPNGVTTISTYAFQNCTSLEEITLPAGFTLVDDYAFAGCSKLATLTFAGDAGANAVIDQAAFEKCTSLKSVVVPEGVTSFGNCLFKNCSSLASVTLPTTLTTLNGNEHFYGTGLTEVIGLENTKLTTISYAMFRGLKTWKPDVIQLPNTLTTISTYGFADVGVNKVILGASVVTISNEAFTGCKSMTEFVLPGGLTTINFNSSTARLFFVTSTDSTYLDTIKTKASATSIVTYADYIANPSNYASGKYVISGYNLCDAFYGGVDYVEGVTDCTQDGTCTRCGRVFEGQEKHAKVETLVFPNGLTAQGTYTCDCTNEGCTDIDILVGDEQKRDVVAPLFTAKGYSVNDSKTAINGGYTINHGTLELYESVNGDIKYGIVIANANSFGGGSFFVDGKVNTTKALQVEINDQYSNFDCSINFGTATKNNSLNLIIAAYVIEGDNVTFIQADSGETVDSSLVSGGSFKSVTLDYVVALPVESKEEL